MTGTPLPGVLAPLGPLLDHYGYLAVAGLIIVEDFGVPAPGETVLIAAAVYAGAGYSARIERTTDAGWRRMLELNLTAPFRCLRRAVPAMRARGYGRVVVIASTAARIGEPYLAAYAASKHGVLGLVRVAAAELAGTGQALNVDGGTVQS